ncbi:putative ATP-dependent helicase IRC3 [Cryptotrichosporon argae]
MHLIPRVAALGAEAAADARGVVEGEEIAEEPTVGAGGADGADRADGQEGRKQTLILVGSVELANQAEAAARRILGDGWTVEVEQSKRVASGRADVTVATYQTLLSAARLDKFDPARFGLVIVDEAHHAAAPSYLRLLRHFNADVAPAPAPDGAAPAPAESTHSRTHEQEHAHVYSVPVVGFSATFSRHDQLALSAVFEEIVYHRELAAMLDEGWLAPVISTSVYADLDLASVEVGNTGDFKTSSLAQHVNTPALNDLVLRTYLHRAADRRSTLVFCVDLAHVDAVVAAFRAAGVDARDVSSLSQPAARRRTIRAFGAGEFPVLVNCEVLTEGTDIPEIDCIILARPTRSRNLLMQMVGRGLRTSPETAKANCYLIDIVDNIAKSAGMVVSPTLLGLTHDEVAEQEAREREARDHAQPDGREGASGDRHEPDEYSVTYIDSDDPFRVSPQGRALAQMTENAWVACGRGKYILELMGVGFLSIDQTAPDRFTIAFVLKLPAEPERPRTRARSPYAARKHVGDAETLERALAGADAYAVRRVGRDVAKQFSRYAAWRKRPASEKQIRMLRKMRGVEAEPAGATARLAGRELDLDTLTAGEAAAFLCAVQHGALGTRKKANKAAERASAKRDAQAEKERAASARNLALPPST